MNGTSCSDWPSAPPGRWPRTPAAARSRWIGQLVGQALLGDRIGQVPGRAPRRRTACSSTPRRPAPLRRRGRLQHLGRLHGRLVSHRFAALVGDRDPSVAQARHDALAAPGGLEQPLDAVHHGVGRGRELGQVLRSVPVIVRLRYAVPGRIVQPQPLAIVMHHGYGRKARPVRAAEASVDALPCITCAENGPNLRTPYPRRIRPWEPPSAQP